MWPTVYLCVCGWATIMNFDREQEKVRMACWLSTCLITGYPAANTCSKAWRACALAKKRNSLFQRLLPLGGREGLQLKAGLVDKYYRQIEVRVPHLQMTAKKNSTGSMLCKKSSSSKYNLIFQFYNTVNVRTYSLRICTIVYYHSHSLGIQGFLHALVQTEQQLLIKS